MNLRKNRHGFLVFMLVVVLILTNLLPVSIFAQAAPTVTDFTKTGIKNTTVNFTGDDFTTHYSDTDTPAEPLQKIQIIQLPEASAGVLKSGDTDIAENAEIEAANVGSIVFVPTTDWTGTTTFKWKGSDGTDYSATEATVTITMAEPAPNQAPVASDLTISTVKDTTVTGVLPATDPDNDPLVFDIVYQPQKGTVVITNEATGAFAYDPNENETGTDFFQFKANDGNLDSNTATVNITITQPVATPTPPPDPPIFVYADLVNHWAYYSAGKLADKGMIVGEKIAGKYYFYPDKIMSRAEFNLFLNVALNIDSDSVGSQAAGFADEDEMPIWILHEARAAKKLGLINGSQEGDKLYYRAHDKINRLETMVILHNALKPNANNEDPLEYADKAQLPDWSVPYVKNMKGYGIIKGYADNTIRPFQTISRAEAAQILYQLIKYKETNP